MSEKLRVNVYLEPEVVKILRVLAQKYGMSLTRVTGLAVRSGVDVLTLVKNPAFVDAVEKYFDKEGPNVASNRGQSPKSGDEA